MKGDVSLDTKILSGRRYLFTTLARNRARRNFFDLEHVASRPDSESAREEGTRCLIHRIEPILQHTGETEGILLTGCEVAAAAAAAAAS